MINPRVYSFNLCLVLSGRSFIEARMAIMKAFPRDQPATVTPPFFGSESDWMSPSTKRAIRIPWLCRKSVRSASDPWWIFFNSSAEYGVDPSYSRRLRQITRSEWELARGRIRLNTPGDCVYETGTLRDAYYIPVWNARPWTRTRVEYSVPSIGPLSV